MSLVLAMYKINIVIFILKKKTNLKEAKKQTKPPSLPVQQNEKQLGVKRRQSSSIRAE